MRTAEEWADYCEQHITAGYTPGGSKRDTYASGQYLARYLRKLGAWKPGQTLVDVGCGNGRLAMGLIGQGVNYHGLEIIKPSVEFCQQAFAGLHRFAFYHLDVRNGRYWSGGRGAPDAVTYPLATGRADVVTAISLFSHTGTLAVAARNLAEMRRVLRPGGLLCASWFLSPPHKGPDTAEKRTVYLRADVLKLLTGWAIIKEAPLPPKTGQTLIIAQRDAGAA